MAQSQSARHGLCMQDFAEDLRRLFTEADALDMGPLMNPGVDPQAAAASMAGDAGVNNLLLQVCRRLDALHAQTCDLLQALLFVMLATTCCRPASQRHGAEVTSCVVLVSLMLRRAHCHAVCRLVPAHSTMAPSLNRHTLSTCTQSAHAHAHAQHVHSQHIVCSSLWVVQQHCDETPTSFSVWMLWSPLLTVQTVVCCPCMAASAWNKTANTTFSPASDAYSCYHRLYTCAAYAVVCCHRSWK